MNAIEAYSKINQQLNVIKESLSKSALSDENYAIEELIENISNKLNDFRPKIMVYGCYNAGKSTLLNAMAGEVRATMGDTPETYKVQPFDFPKYTIYDTPGINAPIEHEEVTFEQYKKCEIILFVMSNDFGVEDLNVYSKLKEIIDNNKPLIIVLNDKMTKGFDHEDTARQMHKIFYNLGKLDVPKEKIDSISVVYVNAKNALRGRTENKNLLLEKSNIKELEARIEELYGRTGIKEVIEVLNLNIENYLNSLKAKLQGSEISKEVKSLRKLLQNLVQQKRASLQTVEYVIKSGLAPMQSEIVASLNNNDQNIEPIVTQYLENVADNLANNFSIINETLKSSLVQFAIDYMDHDFKLDGNIDIRQFIDDKLTGSRDLAVADVPKTQSANFDKKALTGLPALIGTVLAATKFAPYAAPVVAIASLVIGVISIFSGNSSSREDEARQAQYDAKTQQERERAIAIQEAARNIQYKVEDQCIKQSRKSVQEIFDNTIQVVEQVLQEQESKAGMSAEILEQVRKVETMLP